ncbi:MAG TPA: hypothetical protein VK745_13805 [Polyangiaceae bacterium]|jgi:hypothetical protein|nr:hypothetical protein [Polyangiaceae bacterium]
MTTLMHFVDSTWRSARGSGARVGLSVATVLMISVGCSNFFGPGPDPAVDGRVDAGLAGTGGGTSCNPVASIDPSGNGQGCGALYSCLQSSCGSQLSACFGNDNTSFAGSVCQGLSSCIANSGCNSSESSGCLNNAESGCKVCLLALAACEMTNCRSSGNTSPCAASGGGSGNTSTLAANVQVNAIALDTNSVYFETQNGLAKVNKDGSQEQGLGNFNQLSGLGLDANFLYVINSATNSVLAVPKAGAQTNPPALASWMCGGGQGSLALDGSGIYLTSGPDLYHVPIAGGSAGLLTTDVALATGSAWGARVALDNNNVYYVGNGVAGGGQAINSIAKSTLPSGVSCGAQSVGKAVAQAQGSVGGMSLAAGQSTTPGQTESVLFFTDLTSNGLTPELMVHATILGASTPASTGDLATLVAPSTANNGNVGAAIAADADGGYLYFGSFDGIYRIACNVAACGQPELFVPGASATALAFDGDFLYYGDQSSGSSGPPGLKKIAK